MLSEAEEELLSSIYARFNEHGREFYPCMCKSHARMDASVKLIEAGLLATRERQGHEKRLPHQWRILGLTEKGILVSKLAGFDMDL